ncbi:MAG: hypothetical protein AAGA74_20435 [Pseudomonadota bacterium]
MKAFEIARRLDALPVLVTILGIYWLTTTFTVLTARTTSVEVFGPPSGLLNHAPDDDTEKTDPSYLILSNLPAISTQSYVDASTSTDSLAIEDFVYIDEATWFAISVADQAEIIEQSGLVDLPTNSLLPDDEFLDRINQAFARQVGLFEVVIDANGERFVFTGEEFIRWRPSYRFALIPIDGVPTFHCEVNPLILECLP